MGLSGVAGVGGGGTPIQDAKSESSCARRPNSRISSALAFMGSESLKSSCSVSVFVSGSVFVSSSLLVVVGSCSVRLRVLRSSDAVVE